MTSNPLLRDRQTGSALIIALIFLLLMTLLGVTAMRGATMQERMAGNTRDWNVAFQSAEAALREAEQYLLDTNFLPEFNDTNGFYEVNSVSRPVWVGDAPSEGNGSISYRTLLDGPPLAGVAAQPRFYIEELSTVRPAGVETETGIPPEEIFYFRVTAVGYGAAVAANGAPAAAAVLSTVYRSR